MKRVFLVLLFFLPCLVFANSEKIVPSELNLIFNDRTLKLNFEAQDELLKKVPKYFLIVRGTKIPIDVDKLLRKNDLLNIETNFEIEISPEKLHDFFLASSIIRENDKKKKVVITYNQDKKRVLFEGTPQEGFQIDEEKLVVLINEAIRKDKKNILVPAKKVFSDVTISSELKERGISEIIAMGESNFSGSSIARKQNILAGAKKINGTIVRKGRIFSFNQTLGDDITEEAGFVPELVIKGNETTKELGGGICQVSTTVFRAAFSGGFPIRERRNHSYAVPYYKPFGLDAAIYLGALDFRFKNDTPGDILIQSFATKDDNLFFVFYGTDDKRKVKFEGPFISRYQEPKEAIVTETKDLPRGEIQEIGPAYDGFQTEWIRTVKKDKETDKESFISYYRPWRAKQLLGTGKIKVTLYEDLRSK